MRLLTTYVLFSPTEEILGLSNHHSKILSRIFLVKLGTPKNLFDTMKPYEALKRDLSRPFPKRRKNWGRQDEELS